MHAVCDAVLGALGEPDIGHFFKNTDARWQNSPSRVFGGSRPTGRFHRGRLVNVDATVLAEEPKSPPTSRA